MLLTSYGEFKAGLINYFNSDSGKLVNPELHHFFSESDQLVKAYVEGSGENLAYFLPIIKGDRIDLMFFFETILAYSSWLNGEYYYTRVRYSDITKLKLKYPVRDDFSLIIYAGEFKREFKAEDDVDAQTVAKMNGDGVNIEEEIEEYRKNIKDIYVYLLNK